jgi:phage shock protein PspC (stress-responsive transcriptional regulator)
MDFITKLFTRCMAFAVMVMPYYTFAALNTSVQVQGNVLPGVIVGFEASTVNAFKSQVDDAKRGSMRPTKLMRKQTVRHKTRGFFKGIATFFLGSATVIALFVVASIILIPFVCWFIINVIFFPFLPLSPIILPSIALPLAFAVALFAFTSIAANSAYNYIAGRDEFIIVHPDEYADCDMYYEELETEHRRV